ncbi:unknown [Eubacterium sp. CAG:603]|nr:unknown [Eubacterium sp. CAG:603]
MRKRILMAAMLTTMVCLTACSDKNESGNNVKNYNTKESIELSDGITVSQNKIYDSSEIINELSKRD